MIKIFALCSRAVTDPACVTYQQTNNYFTASFKAFPATNFGTLKIDDFRLKFEGILSIRIKKTERSDTANRSAGGSIINLVPASPGWVLFISY